MKIKVIDLLVKYANKELTDVKTNYNNPRGDWNKDNFLYVFI